jgi:hypothetical protein
MKKREEKPINQRQAKKKYILEILIQFEGFHLTQLLCVLILKN